MKATCGQEALSRALGIAGRGVPSRTAVPVLNNILIEAKDGVLEISSTDLEMGIVHRVEAMVESGGAVAVPARDMSEWVKSLPRGGSVTMELDEETLTLHLSCGGATAAFRGVGAEEFPAVARGRSGDDALDAILVPEGLLRDALKQVIFAASKEEYHEALRGVLFEWRDGVFALAAADGYRLAVRRFPYSGEEFSVIVPARAAAELVNIIGASDVSPDDIVSIWLERGVEGKPYTGVVFGLQDTVLSSQLIYGKFPDYRRVIPQEHTTRVVAGRRTLLAACKRAAIVARQASNIVRLDIAGDEMVVFAHSGEVGRVETPVEADVEGAQIAIAFNVRFLMGVLTALDAGRVSLEFTTPNAPAAIRPVWEDDDAPVGDYVYVLMPMRFD